MDTHRHIGRGTWLPVGTHDPSRTRIDTWTPKGTRPSGTLLGDTHTRILGDTQLRGLALVGTQGHLRSHILVTQRHVLMAPAASPRLLPAATVPTLGPPKPHPPPPPPTPLKKYKTHLNPPPNLAGQSGEHLGGTTEVASPSPGPWGHQVTPQRWCHPVQALGTPDRAGLSLGDLRSHHRGGITQSLTLGPPCHMVEVTSSGYGPWGPHVTPVLVLGTPSQVVEVVSPSPGPWGLHITPQR